MNRSSFWRENWQWISGGSAISLLSAVLGGGLAWSLAPAPERVQPPAHQRNVGPRTTHLPGTLSDTAASLGPSTTTNPTAKPSSTPTVFPATTEPQLLLHYDFESLDHGQVPDRTQQHRNGSLHGKTELVSPGRVGTHAIRLQDHGYIGLPPLELNAGFSLALFARQIQPERVGSQTLAANSSGGSARDGFRWFLHSWNSNDRKLVCEFGNGSEGQHAVTAPAVFPQDTEFHHLALVVDRPAGQCRIFLDGQVVGSAAVLHDFLAAGPLRLGQFTDGGANWQGEFDEVRLFLGVLSAAEVQALAAEK